MESYFMARLGIAEMIAVLQAEQACGALPAQISLASADEVDNPFL
jgi:hypothetical protein